MKWEEEGFCENVGGKVKVIYGGHRSVLAIVAYENFYECREAIPGSRRAV